MVLENSLEFFYPTEQDRQGDAHEPSTRTAIACALFSHRSPDPRICHHSFFEKKYKIKKIGKNNPDATPLICPSWCILGKFWLHAISFIVISRCAIAHWTGDARRHRIKWGNLDSSHDEGSAWSLIITAAFPNPQLHRRLVRWGAQRRVCATEGGVVVQHRNVRGRQRVCRTPSTPLQAARPCRQMLRMCSMAMCPRRSLKRPAQKKIRR